MKRFFKLFGFACRVAWRRRKTDWQWLLTFERLQANQREAAFKLAANIEPLPMAQPAWTAGDAETWANFRKTETGIRLVQHMRLQEEAQSAAAVHKGSREACGFANGWRCAGAWLWTLAAREPLRVLSSEDSAGLPTELLERMGG